MTSARHRAAVEDGIVGTLDAGHEQPIVLAVRIANTNSNGHGVAEQVTHTLDGANGQAVVVIDRASFNQGKNAQYPPPYRGDAGDGHAGGEGPPCCVLSNGQEVVGPLCARDHKGVSSEFVYEGKVICQRRSTC